MVYHVALSLETTSLYADEGIIICYALIGQDGVMLANAAATAEEEKNLLKQMIRDLWNLNGLHPSLRIITYNGYNFDYPMIITRLLALGMHDEVARFKKNFDMRSKHLDLYSVIRNNILIKSRKLEDICKYFGIGYDILCNIDFNVKSPLKQLRLQSIHDAKETLELWEKGEVEILKKRCAAHAEVLHKIRRKLVDLSILESG